MSEHSNALLQRIMVIIEKASDASLLLGTGFRLRNPELYDELLKEFGTWESVLAQAVIAIRDKDLPEKEVQEIAEVVATEEQESRIREETASDTVWGVTSTGEVLCLPGEQLPLLEEPTLHDWPTSFGELERVFAVGEVPDVAVFTQKGDYFGAMKEMTPHSKSLSDGNRLQLRLEMKEGDTICTLMPSHELRQYDHRLLHVTAKGKAKATGISEYPILNGKKGREAFSLNDGDKPIAVLLDDEVNALFCASALGSGIHFSTDEVRTMGRKSVGVNIMRLLNESDSVVSAFMTEGVSEIAVLSAQGYVKRLSLREFRKQGRGGVGMQVARLYPEDHIIGVVPCHRKSDLLLTTNLGRWWRVPASQFPVMGRATRGKKIFAIESGEEFIGLSPLPCGGNVQKEEEDSIGSGVLEGLR